MRPSLGKGISAFANYLFLPSIFRPSVKGLHLRPVNKSIFLFLSFSVYCFIAVNTRTPYFTFNPLYPRQCLVPVRHSDAFAGLSHTDRLALVFTTLHDGLAVTSATTSPPSPHSRASTAGTSRPATPKRSARGGVAAARLPTDKSTVRLQSSNAKKISSHHGPEEEGGLEDGVILPRSLQTVEAKEVSSRNVTTGGGKEGAHGNIGWHRVIRGWIKASLVGANVEELPVWGGLDAMAGSSLLVDCRTPAQWRAEKFPPSEQVIFFLFMHFPPFGFCNIYTKFIYI